MTTVIVFGASGSIGGAICDNLLARGDDVIFVGRTSSQNPLGNGQSRLSWGSDPSVFVSELLDRLDGKKIDAVIWAQGTNFNDDIESFDLDAHLKMYEANVTFILSSLNVLMKVQALSVHVRLCVISSIWQNIARQNKLSYCITKSALQGLIQSLSIDLGKKGILINAVLPGALDTAMTRANLTSEQIHQLELATPLQSLPNLSDVTGLVAYLCSSQNTGITGQFIAADRGFSHARIL